MSTWIYRLARASWHARRRVVAVWVALLLGLGAVAADVVWADDYVAGCQFREALTPAAYEALVALN